MAAVYSIFKIHTAYESSCQQEKRRIRAIVIDDSETFLQVVCELIALDPLIDLIARAETGGEAIETVMKLKPDLVLMDVHMPYLDGLTLSRFFTHRFPPARIGLMSSDNTPELWQACEESGALDFVHKENFRQEFRAALQHICSDADQT
jgi:CheY-like chemotaxis protein